MSRKWTALALLGILALVIGTFIVFEVTVQPGKIRREKFAQGVWAVAGVVSIGVVGWHVAAGMMKKGTKRVRR